MSNDYCNFDMHGLELHNLTMKLEQTYCIFLLFYVVVLISAFCGIYSTFFLFVDGKSIDIFTENAFLLMITRFIRVFF